MFEYAMAILLPHRATAITQIKARILSPSFARVDLSIRISRHRPCTFGPVSEKHSCDTRRLVSASVGVHRSVSEFAAQ